MSNKDRYLPIHDYKVMDLDKDELLKGIDIVKRLNKQDKEFKCLEKRFELINNMNWMIKTFIAKYETTNEFKDADEVIDLINLLHIQLKKCKKECKNTKEKLNHYKGVLTDMIDEGRILND